MASLTKPSGENWNVMFKDVHVQEQVAKIEVGAKENHVEKVALKAPVASAYQPDGGNASHMALISTPRGSRVSIEVDPIDAILAGMNFDGNDNDRSGEYCGKCIQPIAKNVPVLKAGGKFFHSGCFYCHECVAPLNISLYFEEDNYAYCELCYIKLFRPQCSACAKSIMETECTLAQGHQYHSDCFACGECKVPLTGAFFNHKGRPYCETHYGEKFCSKCAGCQQPCVRNHYSAGQAHFHLDCFKCTGCKEKLGEGTFVASLEAGPRCFACAALAR